MKAETLTENGIEKLLGGVNGVVVQVLNNSLKSNRNQSYFKCDLSDGYCLIKGSLIVDTQMLVEEISFKNFIVLSILRSTLQPNKNKQPVLFVEKCQIFDAEVVKQIGEPLPYDEFIKNGKKNERGTNLIKNGKIAGFTNKQYLEMMQEPDSTVELQPTNNRTKNNSNNNVKEVEKKAGNSNNQSKLTNNSQINLKNNKPANRNGLRLSDEQENTNRHSSLDNNHNSNTNRTNQPQNKKVTTTANQGSNQNSKSINNMKQNDSPSKKSKSMAKPPQNKNKGPIEKVVPQRKKEVGIKGNQKRPSAHYNQIKSLFVGMENWTILVRVLFVYPMKTFINKKGVESSLLKITVGDSSGTIECTMFGETAQRFEGKFKEDQLYQISNGVVVQSNYMNKRQLKITITENTKVGLSEDDDATIPYSEDLSATVQQLLEVPLGQTNTVVCLVKDSGQIQNITSKAGKALRKKMILLCDPEAKVEVQTNVWGDMCDYHFEVQPYMIKGVVASEYNGNRQYTLKNDAVTKVVKQHRYRKYIKDIQNIAFVTQGSDKKNKQQIHNFKELNNLMDIEGSKGVWTQLVCSLGAVKSSGKNYYLSCPHCKKKVQEESNSDCASCQTHYEEAKPRYILNAMLSDMYDSCWVTLYDQQAELLTGIAASEFAKLNEQGLQDLLKKIRYKQSKMLLLTKNEEFNKEMRKKTSVIKIVNWSYAEETKSVLSRLRDMMS